MTALTSRKSPINRNLEDGGGPTFSKIAMISWKELTQLTIVSGADSCRMHGDWL
jgi:hypothetical protein